MASFLLQDFLKTEHFTWARVWAAQGWMNTAYTSALILLNLNRKS